MVSICFYVFTHTDKYLFIKGIDKTYNNLISNYENINQKYFPYVNDDYYNKTNTNINVKTGEINENISLVGDVYLTSKDNYLKLGLNIDKTKYDLEMLSKDDKLYYKIDDSNYYNTSFNNNTFSTDTIVSLIDVLKRAIKENISGASLKDSKEKITINNKKYNSKKITLNIDEKIYNKIMLSFLVDVKKDDELIKSLLSFSNYNSKEELIKYIEDKINYYDFALKKSDDDKIISKVSIYLDGSNLLRTDIELNGKNNYELSYINYENYFEMNYNEGDEYNSYVRIFNKKIDIFIDGIGYGNGTYSDSSFNINFTNYEKDKIGYINYSYKNNKSDLDLSINLEGFNFLIKSDNEFTNIKSIPNIDIKDSKKMENMNSNSILITRNRLSGVI